MLIVISSPSGGGKDAIIAELIKIFPNSARMVTTTTRPPRANEKNGINYFFVSQEEFETKKQRGDFLEYNNFAGNIYATEKMRLNEMLNKYDFVFTNIDVHGKNSMDKNNFKNLSIFLMPESIDTLVERIKNRGGLNNAQIEERLKIAENELIEAKKYDYRVVNVQGKMAETVQKIAEIIKSQANMPALDKKPQIV